MNPAAPSLPTVLLVDDDADQLYLLQMAAVRSGRYGLILTATDADSARRVAESQTAAIDLIVTDLKLPGLDGVGLVKRLFELRHAAAAAAVVLTSSDAPADRDRITAGGRMRHAEKPASFGRLVELLRDFAPAGQPTC